MLAPATTTPEAKGLSTVHSLEDIYDINVLPAQKSRYDALSLAFEKKFKQKPKLFARSPGRVNLIGEHIDYSGYSVLPMAIDSDIVIAVAVAADSDPCRFKVDISNIDESTYPDQYIDVLLDQPIFINSAIHEWSNYFKCGCKGALENSNHDGLKSMMVMISGTIPAGAGLSSSSALVCASVIATLAIQGINKPKDDLVQIAIRSERYAGVHTGGMDQSISIMGQQGNILMIHFYPTLSISPVRVPTLPVPAVFVIANTLVTADKHVTAPRNYNLRVHIKPEPYTLEDISQELGISTEEARKTFIGELIIYDADGFDLYKRTLHVFSEARRVYMFWDTCAHASKEPGRMLQDLGRLMNESQDSCRDYFKCSCPEIDKLTAICRDSGAFGSRLTGAGWGGCTVSLVKESQVAAFIEKVKNEYYFSKWPLWKSDAIAAKEMSKYIFACKPACGAALVSNPFSVLALNPAETING
ncbi:galactokinase [Batrachochytrium salamandrivorans]|nr:galactokinase [Batrachochytrium salamandrivorans]